MVLSSHAGIPLERSEKCSVWRWSSLLFTKKAESFLLVFLLVFLPLARAGLAGYCDAGRQGLGTAGGWSALGGRRHFNFVRRDSGCDGLNPRVHLLLQEAPKAESCYNHAPSLVRSAL